MSGIAGLFNLDGRPAQTLGLQVMAGIIGHRGPDGVHVWSSGPVGFGHCLLRTTPDAVAQPLVHPSGELAIAADVRLDNRKELGDQLGLRVSDHSPCDAELVLEAYLKWGESCPEHLLGDFAFAIWDGRKRSLFCARDHIGVRPFNYFHQPGKVFAFGSEVKAVLAAPGVPFRVNEARIADYLLLRAIQDQESTFFEGVKRLPPGHWLRADTHSCTARCYWKSDPSYELSFKDDREYVEGFLDLFTRSVQGRLRSVTPIAVQLSGGLDSSFVTCMTNKLYRADQTEEALHTISCIYDEYPECDERPYINAVLEWCQLSNSHFVHPDQHSPLESLEQVVWEEDGPSFAHNYLMNREMARTVAGQRVRVILDGMDGDTIVSYGYELLYELAFMGDWDTFAHEAASMEVTRNRKPMSVFHTYGGPVLAELARSRRWKTWYKRSRGASAALGLKFPYLAKVYGIGPFAPRFMRARSRHVGIRPPQELPGLIHPDLAKRTGRPTKPEPAVRKPQEKAKDVHYGYLTSGGHGMLLEMVERIASQFSVEQRHPYFDRRLVEYCLALPANQKLRDGWGRSVMRRAMEGIVPPEVQWRKGKTDLASNFVNGVHKLERTRLDRLQLDGACLDGYIDRRHVVSAVERFISRPEVDDAGKLLWPVLNLAAWLPGLEARYEREFQRLKRKELGAPIGG